MNKLDIHEFLRIYLPGLFITFVVGKMLYGPSLDNASTATAAIFVGLAFSWIATRLSQQFFMKITDEKHFDHTDEKTDYWCNWIHLVQKKVPRRLEHRALTREDVKSISVAHYVRRYGSPDLYSFRLPKSFGVLYFNVAVAAGLLSFIPALHIIINKPTRYYTFSFNAFTDIPSLIIMALIFGIISRDYFIRSLKMELFYWVNPPDDVDLSGD